ncbi:MAG: GNAT family N-acetyltransferase [Lachnospiraceae bacterium]|nr:GNAT family N-acetyltransferase [Lachnospiraceae bacterium]
MCTQKERTLRYVLLDLSQEWDRELNILKEKLIKEDVSCAMLTEEIWKTSKERKKQTVVLTDSEETGRRLAREGIVYFGCQRRNRTSVSMDEETAYPQQTVWEARNQENCFQKTFIENTSEGKRSSGSENGWFDGAALVLEGFGEVDADYLEEWLLRAQGLPAEIARTKRLVIREMTEGDLPDLVRISRQSGGMGVDLEWGAGAAISDQRTRTFEMGAIKANPEADAFSEDRLRAYIHNAYRMQGFGLWSVLYQERVIGCCGFEPCGSQNIYTHRLILSWADEGRKEESLMCERRTVDGQIDEVQDRADEGQMADNGQMNKDRADEGRMDTGQIDEGQTDKDRTDGEPLPERQENEHGQSRAVPKQILEMQYMLDAAYHRQGFGTEMCRAALAYARERLDADEVRLRIDEKNHASRALAEKLNFSVRNSSAFG